MGGHFYLTPRLKGQILKLKRRCLQDWYNWTDWQTNLVKMKCWSSLVPDTTRTLTGTHYTLHYTTHYTLHTTHYTTLHTTLHYTTLHYTTHYTTLHTTLQYEPMKYKIQNIISTEFLFFRLIKVWNMFNYFIFRNYRVGVKINRKKYEHFQSCSISHMMPKVFKNYIFQKTGVGRGGCLKTKVWNFHKILFWLLPYSRIFFILN